MENNLFEIATRNKLRFASSRGDLSVEQLWDVPLRSKDDFNLNEIAKTAYAKTQNSELNFVNTTPTKADRDAELVFSIVQHVISVKVAEAEAREKTAERKKQAEALREALVRKKNQEIEQLSSAELEARLKEIESAV